MNRRRLFAVLLVTSVLALMPAAPRAWSEAQPLLSVLPDDALVILWSPDPGGLIAGINQFTPGPQADIPLMELEDGLAEAGIPEEVLEAPAAVVIRAPENWDNKNEEPHVVFLFCARNLDAAVQALGKPDADGIYGADPAMMPYRGYLAVGGDGKDALKALKAAPHKPYEPSAQAKKIMENAQLFAHVNITGWLNAFAPEIDELRREIRTEMEMELEAEMVGEDLDPMAQAFVLVVRKLLPDATDFFFELMKEFKSFDAAAQFDPQGLNITSLTAVTEKGYVARYLVPSEGLGKLDPALPALDRFLGAAWYKWDEKSMDALFADYEKVASWALSAMPSEEGEAKALMEKFASILENAKELIGKNFGCVVNFSDGAMGLAEVVEVNNPDKVKAVMATNIATSNEIVDSMLKLSEEAPFEFKYVYEPDFKTIAGVSTDRMKAVFTAADPAVQPELDKAMSIYGPEGMSYLVGVVGDKLVMSMSEKDMERALAATQGRAAGGLLADDPSVRSMANKIGLDKDMIVMFVPVRAIEMTAQMMMKMSGQEGEPPAPLPFATPVAFGSKTVDATTVRCDAYVPQACIAECMTAVMGVMMMGMGGGGF